MPPTVGVVFAPCGAATLRDLVRQQHLGSEVLLVLPQETHDAYPELAQVGAALLAGVWVLGSEDAPPKPLDAVLTFSDELLELTAALAATVSVHWGVSQQALDKYLQRRVLIESGLTGVRTSLARTPEELRSAVETCKLPGFIKSRRGHGGYRVRELKSGAQVDSFADSVGQRSYFESAVPQASHHTGPAWLGDMVSVEVAAPRAGRAVAVAAFSKLPIHRVAGESPVGVDRLVTTGNLYPWGLPLDLARDVLVLAEKSVEAIGVRGALTHVEIKIGAHGPDVIEVNCRAGGHLDAVVRAAGGPDLVAVAVALASGKCDGDWLERFAPPPEPPSYALGVRIPNPAGGREIRSRLLSRDDLDDRDGIEVLAVHSPGGRIVLDDDYAANILFVASSVDQLEMKLANVLALVQDRFAANGLPDTPWMRSIRNYLPDPRRPTATKGESP